MSKQQLAQELFDNGSVQQVTKDVFVCHGSGSNQYEIKRVHDSNYNYEFYCKCPAWKFDSSRQCKHVLAVKLFEKSATTTHTHPQTKTRSIQDRSVSKQYKIKPKKVKSENVIDNKGMDGKNKPLKFDKHGKLIIQYTEKVMVEKDDEFEDVR